MKKIWRILVLPIMALVCLCGCGEKRDLEDIQKLYQSMTEVCIIEEDNKFFSNSTKPNSLQIKYSQDVNDAINNPNYAMDTQKRFVALGYQQKILDSIYNFYESNQEDFYRLMSSKKDVDKDEYKKVYDSLNGLKVTLEDFAPDYKLFAETCAEGLSDIMYSNMINYTYKVNKVIDKSFGFIYDFIDMYDVYCLDKSAVTVDYLQFEIEKTQVDMSYLIYLENIKSFNVAVSAKGVCDLAPAIDFANDYVLLDNLTGVKTLSMDVINNITEGSTKYEEVKTNIDNFLYFQEIFEQKFDNYLSIYNESEDEIYAFTQHKFNLVNNINTYMNSLSASKRATMSILLDFVDNTYVDLVESFNIMVN